MPINWNEIRNRELGDQRRAELIILALAALALFLVVALAKAL